MLLKDIAYDDMDEDDLTVLESGCFQVLPDNRDRSGRIVAVSVRNNDHHFKSWKNYVSCFVCEREKVTVDIVCNSNGAH